MLPFRVQLFCDALCLSISLSLSLYSFSLSFSLSLSLSRFFYSYLSHSLFNSLQIFYFLFHCKEVHRKCYYQTIIDRPTIRCLYQCYLIQKGSPLYIRVKCKRIQSLHKQKNNFESILSIMQVKNMPILHTHTQHTLISDSFGGIKFCSLRVEGRRGW